MTELLEVRVALGTPVTAKHIGKHPTVFLFAPRAKEATQPHDRPPRIQRRSPIGFRKQLRSLVPQAERRHIVSSSKQPVVERTLEPRGGAVVAGLYEQRVAAGTQRDGDLDLRSLWVVPSGEAGESQPAVDPQPAVVLGPEG